MFEEGTEGGAHGGFVGDVEKDELGERDVSYNLQNFPPCT